MKTLIIYDSRYGTTKTYAESLALKLNSRALPVKHVKKIDIEEANQIVLGCSLFVSKLRILKRMKKHLPLLQEKEVYVFAVGLSKDAEEVTLEKVKKDNPLLDDYNVKLMVHFPGKLDINTLNFFHRAMMKMVRKMLTKQETRTKDEDELLHVINNPEDNTDLNQLDRLIHALKE